jgi:hypothetical protein
MGLIASSFKLRSLVSITCGVFAEARPVLLKQQAAHFTYNLSNGLPTPYLPVVTGEPPFTDIQLTTRLLNTNTFSVT